jgi:hypothetical protein
VPNATTVNVPVNDTVSIAITGLSGYAMRLQGTYPPLSNSAAVTTAVQVEQ